MFRYHYFIKQTNLGALSFKKFQCIRIPEGDARIPEFTQTYYTSGLNLFIPYQFKPTVKDEIFQLQMKLRAWEAEFEIQDPQDEKSKWMS